MLVEKYRPKKLTEVVGQDAIVKQIKGFLERPDGLPHLLFTGKQGIGKTTLAHVIATELFGKFRSQCFYEFNASNDRGIEVVRNNVTDIARSSPLSHPYKIILMDEADHITADAQACFRRIIELYQKNTRFIFTCNYPYKIIAPLLSRFVVCEFKNIEPKIITEYIQKISKLEGKEIDSKLAENIGKKCDGDLRRALNYLETGVAENSSEFWENVTLDKLKKMSPTERINLAFVDEPEKVFANIWDFVKRESLWKVLPLLVDCQGKMNYAAIKDVFVANLLAKLGE
jgi:replication factor C small subunit